MVFPHYASPLLGKPSVQRPYVTWRLSAWDINVHVIASQGKSKGNHQWCLVLIYGSIEVALLVHCLVIECNSNVGDLTDTWRQLLQRCVVLSFFYCIHCRICTIRDFSHDRLIFMIGILIPIPGKTAFILKQDPASVWCLHHRNSVVSYEESAFQSSLTCNYVSHCLIFTVYEYVLSTLHELHPYMELRAHPMILQVIQRVVQSTDGVIGGYIVPGHVVQKPVRLVPSP